jgi:hypothetical protein
MNGKNATFIVLQQAVNPLPQTKSMGSTVLPQLSYERHFIRDPLLTGFALKPRLIFWTGFPRTPIKPRFLTGVFNGFFCFNGVRCRASFFMRLKMGEPLKKNRAFGAKNH